jgi:hypothetical protein
MVVWVWVMRDFWTSGVEREKGRITGKFSKISFFSPVSAFAGEKLHRAVQNGTVQFFFLKKRKTKFEGDLKLSYDNRVSKFLVGPTSPAWV